MRRRAWKNIASGGPGPNTAMILEFTTTTSNEIASLGRYNNVPSGYDCTIDWGDGSPLDSITDDGGDIQHTYVTAGVYQVKIQGRFAVNPTTWMETGLTDIIDWGTSNDTVAGHLFDGCEGLTVVTAPASTFNSVNLGTSNSFLIRFDECINLSSIDLDFDFSPTQINRPAGMSFQDGFSNTSITSADISGWGVDYFSFASVFFGCDNLTTVALDSRVAAWDKCITLSSTFRNTFGLTSLTGYENMCQASCTNCLFTFNGTNLAQALNLNSWDVSSVATFQGFMGNADISDVQMDQWSSTTKATLRQMFFNFDNGPANITLGSIKASSCQEMFENNESVVNVDMSNVDFSECISFQEMFRSTINAETFLHNLGTTTISIGSVNFVEMFRFAGKMGLGETFTFPTCTISGFRSWGEDSRYSVVDLTNAQLLNNSQSGQNWFGDMNLLTSIIGLDAFLDTPSTYNNFNTCFNATSSLAQSITMPAKGYANCQNTFFNTGASVDCGLMVPTGSLASMFQNINGILTGVDTLDISGVTSMSNFLSNRSIDTVQYDAALIYWDNLTIGSTFDINMGSSQYTLGGAAEAARTSLIGKGFTITDGGGI